jgi:hypothetical protein
MNADSNEGAGRLAGNATIGSKSSVVMREIVGETFLVPIHGHIADLQELFVLNEVGRYLWDRLDGMSSVDELIAAVFSEFNVEEQEARRDTLMFLEDLMRAGLAEKQGLTEE